MEEWKAWEVWQQGGLSKGVCYIYREWNAQEQKFVKGQGPAQGRFRWHVSGALRNATCSGRRRNLSAAGQSLSQRLLSASSLCTSLNYLFTIIWRWTSPSLTTFLMYAVIPLPSQLWVGLGWYISVRPYQAHTGGCDQKMWYFVVQSNPITKTGERFQKLFHPEMQFWSYGNYQI